MQTIREYTLCRITSDDVCDTALMLLNNDEPPPLLVKYMHENRQYQTVWAYPDENLVLPSVILVADPDKYSKFCSSSHEWNKMEW